MYLHREPLLVRLGKLAESGRTGALRLSGDCGGTIYLSEGDVVYAESKQTPGLAKQSQQAPEYPYEDEAVSQAGSVPARMNHGSVPILAANLDPGTARSLERSFAVREATVDALLDLLVDRSRNPPRQRFRAFVTPDVSEVSGMSVAALTVEVKRRQEITRQLSTFLTADKAVVRNPILASPSLQVSGLQWALLIRMGERSTPRSLAWELGHSVFGTTIELFRLIVLGFVSVVDAAHPPAATAPDERPGNWRNAVSFLRAVDPAIKTMHSGARGEFGNGDGDSR